jgi:hypothetical protein
MSALDLLILPLVRTGGQDQPDVPGLHVARPPRRAARGRDRDQLVLYLALAGSAPLSAEQIGQLLENLAKTYYHTSGTVTTAQRAVADSINQYLLDRNLRNASTGNQAIGLLTQAVLRGGRLSLAQSGPTHAFLITAEGVQHFYDPQLAGRGLGLTRTTTIRYLQADLQLNDALVLTPEPPAAWTPASLQSVQGQGPESLRRRVLSQAGTELNGALLHAQPGTGQLRLLRPVRPARPRLSQPGMEANLPLPARSEEAEESPEATPPSWETAHPPAADLTRAGQPPPSGEGARLLPVQLAASSESSEPLAPTRPPRPARQARTPAPGARAARPPGAAFAPVAAALGKVGRASSRAAGGSIRAAAELLQRMLPDAGLFTLPASTMAFVAIAVPLLVVTVSSMVYFQRGRAAQYQVYFAEAQAAASKAQAETEPPELRSAWEATLELLDRAESYQTTADSTSLRAQAQGALDGLDFIDRLDFQPALVDSLKDTANITRMVATDGDLYLLNAREGVVLRATLTNSGYRLDPIFQCGPGPYGGVIVGAITDITALPKGNEVNATLLGIDANGNLLYCIPGDAPVAVTLSPPDINWGTPQGLTYDTDDLYILDPQTNAVWIYRRMEVSQEPRLFFGDQIPPMQDVVDMAVNLNDLYLLHTDGHITTCVFSGLIESPTRCEDPATYGEPRPGRQNGPVIEGAYFTEILFAPPPDPSIYMLEPNSQAVYHFSVRLTFQRQYRSREPLPEGPATAFAISRGNRTVLMAVGNEVFYAGLP